MPITINKETGKRFNVNGVSAEHPFKGFSKLDTLELRAACGIVDIPDDEPPEEFVQHPDWYFVHEDEEATCRPYTKWDRKPQDMIDAMGLAKATAQRQAAYINESDPLFFKEQRKEVPEGTWLAKVAEIKERFPK